LNFLGFQPDCRGGIEGHVLHHADAHRHIRARENRLRCAKGGSPQQWRHPNGAAWQPQSVENSAGHLALGERLASRQRVGFVDGSGTRCGGDGSDRQIFRCTGCRKPGAPPTSGMKPNRRISRDNGVMLVSRPSE